MRSISTPIQISNGVLAASIEPSSGAIGGLQDEFGNEWLWRRAGSTYKPEDGGCFPMVPYCNRIAGGRFVWKGRTYLLPEILPGVLHALHGDGWVREWSVVERSASSVRLRLASDFGPFDYSASQTVSLKGHTLVLHMELVNTGDWPMPFGVGFHPFFARDDDTCLWAPAEAMWEEDDEHLPTERVRMPGRFDFSQAAQRVPGGFVNHLFEGWPLQDSGMPRAMISYPSRSARLSISASPELQHYMLYVNHDAFVCFEPVSHRVNEHNSEDWSGLKVLAPGEKLSASMSVAVESGVERPDAAPL